VGWGGGVEVEKEFMGMGERAVSGL